MTGRGMRGQVATMGAPSDVSRVIPGSATSDDTGKPDGERKRVGGLVLSRHVGESIMIGDAIEVEVIGLKSGTARIRIDAPREVPVHRLEVYAAIRENPRPVAPDLAASPHGPRPGRNGPGGLVLTRHPGESIMIGDNVAVEVVDIRPSAVRLRVAAPREVSVHRREIYEALRESIG